VEDLLVAKAEAKRESGAKLQKEADHLRKDDHLRTRVIGHRHVSFTYKVSVVRVRVVQNGIPPCADFTKVETVIRVRIALFCTLSLPALPMPNLPLLLLLLLIPQERIRKIRRTRIRQSVSQLPWILLPRAESVP